MKIIYCTHSTYSPGGMERVLANKIGYLAEHTDAELLVVTTDQKGREPYYPYPAKVRTIDLGIDYSDDNAKNIFRKITGYLHRRRLHRRRLSALLTKEKADIVVSLFPSESSFIPNLTDGSKKVLELHFCKFFRLQYGRSGLIGWLDRRRSRSDERLVRRFDAFVVLTEEDRGYWGDEPGITVIPNAARQLPAKATGHCRRVIAVGRLDYQKSFDRLIQVWGKVQATGRFHDWHLDIFGQGPDKDKLEHMISQAGLSDTAAVNPPTPDIDREYASSSILAMTSRYEGFPMVLVEGMAAGLPAVTFDFKCGPKEIIRHGTDGFIVPDGNIDGFATCLMTLMDNDGLRLSMSAKAAEVADRFNRQRVMQLWLDLFHNLCK